MCACGPEPNAGSDFWFFFRFAEKCSLSLRKSLKIVLVGHSADESWKRGKRNFVPRPAVYVGKVDN